MNWLVGVAVAGLGAVVLQVLAEEFRDWCPWLAERLIRLAVRQLPDAHRDRYEEEWLAELGEVPGKLATLVMAVGILGRARGPTHHQALRALGSRLVGVLHGCLAYRTVYQEQLAWPAAEPAAD